jgi:hypothetical protein
LAGGWEKKKKKGGRGAPPHTNPLQLAVCHPYSRPHKITICSNLLPAFQ